MKDPIHDHQQTTLTKPSQLSSAVSDRTQLTFNILPFEHPERTMEFTFSSNENNGEHRFCIQKLPFEASRFFPGLDPQHPFVYTNFDTGSGGITVKIDFTQQQAVARAWYTLKIRDFLGKTANVTVTNFLNDCQFWYIDKKDVNSSSYDVYKKFTLRVQTDHRTGKPELLVSFDGKKYILKKSLARLTENASFDTSRIESVLYRNKLYTYDPVILKDALYHPDEIFPVISKRNMSALNVTLPSEINSRKYLSTYSEIDAFFHKYLDTDDFRSIIPHKAKWKTALPSDVNRLNHTGRELVFGQDQISSDIFGCLRNYGPYDRPKFKHFKVFMIYYETDQAAAQKLKEYIIKKEGFGSLAALTRMPIEYDPELDIVIAGNKNPAEVISESLQVRTPNPETGYFAFYISPYTRFETDPVKREIYFKIKEIMLRKNIGLQVIERAKLFGKFDYSIANIGIAMIAKMGGIPWRLSNQSEKELIIGFGAFTSQRYNAKYVGSAFCFSNDGEFQEFNCFPADETWSIAGSAEEALIAYRLSNPDVKRMVIHFYQKIGRKHLKPIEDMLRRLKFDIPVLIVRINKTFSESQLVFDEAFAGKMPLNGSYVNLGRNEYLFCNNQREDSASNPSSLPLPIKIGLQSTHTELLEDPVLVEKLMMQVYEFSFMHWRSVKQQNLPVTVTYPEMLARLFSWFDNKALIDEERKSLFFL